MSEAVLVLSLLVVAAAAAYAIYRGISPPAQPSRFEDETTKNRLALMFAASGAINLARYFADREDTLALLAGLILVGGAVHSYLRPATALLPDSERLWRYRLTALIAMAAIATLLLMTARPEWSHQIIWYWGVGAAVMLAWGVAREILHRR